MWYWPVFWPRKRDPVKTEPVSDEFKAGWLACIAHMDKVYTKFYATSVRDHRKAYREAWDTLITNAKIEATDTFGEKLR